MSLTNVAGATDWFSDDASAPGRETYTRTLSDGTVGVADHEDAHTVSTDPFDFLYEKTVVDPGSGTLLTTAAPGDTLRYRLRFENRTASALSNLGFADETDRLNASPLFEPGSLTLVTVPGVPDTSGTDPNGGAAGTGVLDVRDLSVAPGASVLVEFDVTLVAVIPDGTLVTDQADLLISGLPFGLSDDPNVNGAADPGVAGDEDPTVVQIQSAPAFQVEKVSDDQTGDPAVLLPGDTLLYTITVVNLGNEDALDVTLRDAVPANTTYVSGSTTLNGNAVPDGVGGSSPLAAGILINAPSAPGVPGSIPAALVSDPANVATVTFEVVVDANVVDGTIISNQGFVTSLPAAIVDVPSDDPDTPVPDDPTRDVVGALPLLFAAKDAVLLGDPTGIVDPGDTLRYTITVLNSANVPATAASLQDAVPTNTTYLAGTTTLNGLLVADAAGGGSPLVAGFAISSSDLTPPLPAAGAGVISPGETATVVFDVLVDAGVPPGTIISNQATVATDQVPSLPSDGDGDPATGPEPTIVVVGAAQQLAIAKQVNVVGGGPALAGSTLEYLVSVTNVASIPATDVLITDLLDPAELAYVAGSATLQGVAIAVVPPLISADYSAVYGPLAPGATALLRFRAVLDAGLAIGTSVTNTADVAWNDPPQLASASVTIDVGGIPGVGMLNGSLWHDADFDRLQGLGERALAGWSIEILRNGQTLRTVQSDASGAYSIGGLAPNDVSGDAYELVFRAPGAGAATAALGVTESPFTNGYQRIRDIVVGSGANLQGLQLPIDPNGVVYGALPRTPVAGVRLALLDAATQVPLPASCFDDPAQQDQVTGADGYYKFSLNFSVGACPSGGDYLIAVAPPGGGFARGYSEIIPPSSDDTTAAFSVPTCSGGAGDAVPATAQHCEAQGSEFAPAATVPVGAGTAYYMRVSLDASQLPGSSQIFNNHIPIDPVLGSAVSITKTTPKVHVSRGELVPYEIVVSNQLGADIAGLGIVDDLPPGFKYVEGSARVNGVPREPDDAQGGSLVWDDLGIRALQTKTLGLLLAVGAGVGEGEHTNRALAINTPTGTRISAIARATVQVVPDPTFDCTDVIGKVFDDADRDGIQDEGEPGLAGVRLATVRGLLVTTDAHGRYHITCAVVPREDRGSNFVLKLDDRTLPSRLPDDHATDPASSGRRAVRHSAISFGASIQRVVGIDMADRRLRSPATSGASRAVEAADRDAARRAREGSPRSCDCPIVADVEEARPRRSGRTRRPSRSCIKKAAWKKRGGTLAAQHRDGDLLASRHDPVTEPRERASSSPGAARDRCCPPVDAGPPGARFAAPVESGRATSAERRALRRTWTVDPEGPRDRPSATRLEERAVLSEKLETVKLTQRGSARSASSPAWRTIGPSDGTSSGSARILDEHAASPRTCACISLATRTTSRYHRSWQSNLRQQRGPLARARRRGRRVPPAARSRLPPESISFELGRGRRSPSSTNTNAEVSGRALNRRVEVEVWYDEVGEETRRQGSRRPEARSSASRSVERRRSASCVTGRVTSDVLE